MKPLTPFQKKVARWCNKSNYRKDIFVACSCVFGAVIMMVLSLGPFFIWGKRLGEILFETKKLDGLFIMLSFVVGAAVGVILANLSETERLPEVICEKAREYVEEFPQLANHLNSLIQKATAEDDGSELQGFLKKLEELETLKGHQRSYQDSVHGLNAKIAALEKELGM